MPRKIIPFTKPQCPGIFCEASTCVLEEAAKDGVKTYVKRMEDRAIQPCLFGQGGTCCRNCSLGPCMMIDDVPETIGICGATPETVVARNFARMVASGAAAHMDHGRETALTFLAAAKGECPFEITRSRLEVGANKILPSSWGKRPLPNLASRKGPL